MAKLNTKIVMLEGEQGKDGTNIKSVEKSASDGLTDTYTITLTDGSKSSFNVTNGKGISSIEKTSANTYKINYNDGTTLTITLDVDTELSTTSTNPVQNKAIAEGINAIQSQIVPTASIESGETASKAYSKGDFLVKDGILYKVTKDIAKGDTLTVGTNIAMATFGSELSEISARLSDITQLSLDAVAVGKDEDGDTIYEKTFKGSTISINTDTVVDSSLTVSNLKWIRLVGGCFNDSNAVIHTLPYDASIINSGSRYVFQVFSNTKGLVVECWDVSVKMYHFTVQYVLK